MHSLTKADKATGFNLVLVSVGTSPTLNKQERNTNINIINEGA